MTAKRIYGATYSTRKVPNVALLWGTRPRRVHHGLAERLAAANCIWSATLGYSYLESVPLGEREGILGDQRGLGTNLRHAARRAAAKTPERRR